MRSSVGIVAVLGPLVAGCVGDGDVTVAVSTQNMEMGDEMGGHNCPGPAPIMQVGDFDGDGTVTAADVDALSTFKDSGDYAAFFDMNADGVLDGNDVSAVALNLGKPGTLRDKQMAQLWATTVPYRNIGNAYAAGYIPFTPALHGHGIHFANFNLIYSFQQRGGWNAHQPEGLNYTEDGRLVAAFYYGIGAVDLNVLYPTLFPPNMFYKQIPVPPSFEGVMPHEWHDHIGPCFGGATSPVPGFDQCMTRHECLMGAGGTLWSPGFHMLHVWLYEFNECGPFAGIDHDVSPTAPMEPNHNACSMVDVVPCVVIGTMADGTPMCAEGDGHEGH